MLQDHIDGRDRYGIPFVDAEGCSDKFCLDLDVEDHELVKKILLVAKELHLVVYVELSKSRGFHVWAFFDKAIPARIARLIGKHITARVDMPTIEVNPKQSERGDFGSWVFSPLHGGSLKEGSRTAFLDTSNGLGVLPDQGEALRDIRRNSLESIAAAQAIAEEAEKGNLSRSEIHGVVPAIVPEKIIEGSRNNSLASMAGTMRRKGLSQAAIEAALLVENLAKCDPPLPESEVRKISASIAKYKPADPISNDIALPVIFADTNDLTQQTAASWCALAQFNVPERLFRWGGGLARIEEDDEGKPLIRELTVDRLRNELDRRTDWRTSGKGGSKRKKRKEAKAKPPIDIVRNLLATPSESIRLPILSRLVTAPFFAPDGTLQMTDGYHAGARTFLALHPELVIHPVPENPSSADIECAKTLLLDDVLGEFPFISASDRTHAMALMFLPFVRPMIPGPTPLFLIEAPTAGMGKGLLAKVCLNIGTGQQVGIVTEVKDDEELRKRLTSQLLTGKSAILFDNLSHPLSSGVLAAALTATLWEDRALGTNRMLSLPIQCAWVATANNPTMTTEIARRSIRIRLDAAVDHPWERAGFRHESLDGFVSENRGRLMHACLVLVQAWLAAGRIAPKVRPLGSFEDWTRVIGGILENVSIPGFLGNLAALYEEADTEGTMWRQIVALWWDKFGDSPVGTNELYPLAITFDGIDLGKSGSRSEKTIFGKMLGKQRDRVLGNFRIMTAGILHNSKRFKLVPIKVGSTDATGDMGTFGDIHDPV